MEQICLVQHCYEVADFDEVKYIGAYSSEKRAKEAVERLMHLSGFKEFSREHFSLEIYRLNEDADWKGGFYHAVDEGDEYDEREIWYESQTRGAAHRTLQRTNSGGDAVARYVYILEHVYRVRSFAEGKLIGVYDSRAAAEEAVTRFEHLPGFCYHPQECFHIMPYGINQTHWTEGFADIKVPTPKEKTWGVDLPA